MLDTFRKTIGDRLRQCRLEKQWTTSEAGREIGVTQARYSNWENATRLPDPASITKAAEVYGEKAEWLAGYTHTRGTKAGKFPYVTAGNTKVLLNDQTTAVLDEFTSDNVAFHQGYLANRGLDESKLLLLRVSDNAMGDIAAEGDEVLIDQKETTVAKTDLFALVVNGRIWIRWIRPELDGSFSVASENQELYPSVSMPDLERVNIIGRVCRISKDR